MQLSVIARKRLRTQQNESYVVYNKTPGISHLDNDGRCAIQQTLLQDVASASVALKVQGAAAAAMEGSSRQVRDQIAQLWVRSGEIERELPKLRREVADTQLRVDSRFASVGLNGSAVLGPTNFRGRIVIVGAGVIRSVAASMLGAVTDVRAMLPVKRVVHRTETTFRASFLVDTGLPGTYFTQTTIDALGLNVADNQSVFW